MKNCYTKIRIVRQGLCAALCVQGKSEEITIPIEDFRITSSSQGESEITFTIRPIGPVTEISATVKTTENAQVPA